MKLSHKQESEMQPERIRIGSPPADGLFVVQKKKTRAVGFGARRRKVKCRPL